MKKVYDIKICCQGMNESVADALIFGGVDDDGNLTAKMKLEGLGYGTHFSYCPFCGKVVTVIVRKVDGF